MITIGLPVYGSLSYTYIYIYIYTYTYGYNLYLYFIIMYYIGNQYMKPNH